MLGLSFQFFACKNHNAGVIATKVLYQLQVYVFTFLIAKIVIQGQQL